MIFFSPAKINIGLQILEKRPDGFHNIQSVMYPTGLCDILEIKPLHGRSQEIRFSQSGIRFASDLEDNLCLKAWELFSRESPLPPLEMHLHKQIPVGAGLGCAFGASAVASREGRGDFDRNQKLGVLEDDFGLRNMEYLVTRLVTVTKGLAGIDLEAISN